MAKGGSNNSNVINKQSGSMGKIIFIIFILLIVIIIIYIINWMVSAANKESAANPVIINDVIDANKARPAFNLPEVTDGMGQSFST